MQHVSGRSVLLPPVVTPLLKASGGFVAMQGLISVLAWMFGVPLFDAFKHGLYNAAYVILPGAVLLGLVRDEIEGSWAFVTKAWVVGQCAEMAIGLIFHVIEFQNLYRFLPAVYGVIGFAAYRHGSSFIVPSGNRGRQWEFWAFFAVAASLNFAAGVFNFEATGPSGGGVDAHFLWVAAYASATLGQWPVPEPFLLDVPLKYHYLFNIHVGLVNLVTGIPLIFVASRLAILTHGVLFLAVLFSFCRTRFRAGWVGIVAGAQMFLNFGQSPIMWRYFHFATALVSYQVPSTLVAFEIFVLLADEIGRLGAAEDIPRRRAALIGLLLLVASGVRAMLLPVVIGGLGLVFLDRWHKGDRRWRFAATLAAAVGGMAVGLVFFYGFAGETDSTKMLTFAPLNLAVADTSGGSPEFVSLLVTMGLPAAAVAAIYLVTALCGRLTFLLPGVAFAAIGGRVLYQRDIGLFFGGVVVAAVALLVFIESKVTQEIWAFYWFADIALAIVGALGLRELWRRRATARFAVRAGAIVAFAALGLQVRDFANGFLPASSSLTFPRPQPIFNGHPSFTSLVRWFEQNGIVGDVVVTGGLYESFDDMTLPAAVPGLQLYAARASLNIYAVRSQIDARLRDRMYLRQDRLVDASRLVAISREVPPRRRLLLLWVGDDSPPYAAQLRLEGRWPGLSLWRIPRSKF